MATGKIVWWDAENLKFNRQKAIEIWKNLFGTKFPLPEQIKMKSALLWTIRRGNRNEKISRKIKEDNNFLSVAIGSLELESETVEFQEELLVKLEKDSETVLVKEDNILIPITDSVNPNANLLWSQILKRMETFTGDDFRKLMLQIIAEENGVTLRMHGGIYFLPNSATPTLEKLQDFATSIGVTLYSVETGNDETTKESLMVSAVNDFLSELETVKEKITDKVRQSTIDKLVAEVETIISKSEIYEALLDRSMNAIKEKAEEVRKELRNRIDREISIDFDEVQKLISELDELEDLN